MSNNNSTPTFAEDESEVLNQSVVDQIMRELERPAVTALVGMDWGSMPSVTTTSSSTFFNQPLGNIPEPRTVSSTRPFTWRAWEEAMRNQGFVRADNGARVPSDQDTLDQWRRLIDQQNSAVALPRTVANPPAVSARPAKAPKPESTPVTVIRPRGRRRCAGTITDDIEVEL